MVVDAFVEHWNQLKAERGVSVTYKRDGEADEVMTLVPAQTQDQVLEESGYQPSSTEFDLIACVSEFKINDVKTKPQQYDRVEFTVNGEAVFGRVNPTFDNREWRYMDQTRVLMRIHLDEVDS